MAAPPTRLDGRGRCVHEYIACDGCDVNPIVGFRYNSVHEPNKDYCESCFRKLARGKRDVFYRVSHVHGEVPAPSRRPGGMAGRLHYSVVTLAHAARL